MKKLLFAIFLLGCTNQTLSDEDAIALIKQRPEVISLMEEKGDAVGFIVGDSIDHPGWALVKLNGLNEAGSLSVNYGEYLVERTSGAVEPF